MSSIAYDHRLVQTAVVGDKHSDHPVILPMDAYDLDLWRRKHPRYRYWCGLELGGCGGELSDKRYEEKVCHFAHHPDAPICHRTAKGESSADHLFIKRGVRRLMDRQRVRGNVQTRNLGTGPGDAVDVHLPDAGRRIRFQLSPLNYGDWRDADDELRADAYGVDWIFGPGVVIARELSGRGYCLRVDCETNGGERVVRIAATTETRRSPDWTPLDDCMLSPSGITSPLVEEIRIAAPHPQPAAFPVQGTLLFTLHVDKSVPNDSPFVAEGRRLVVADVKPAESPIVRSLLSLPADTALPPAENVYEVRGVARLLVRERQGWAVQADRFVRLDAHAAERSGLRRSGHTAEEGKRDQTAPKKPAELEARAERAAPKTKRRDAAPEAPTDARRPARPWSELVLAVREALAQTAHLRATTSWKTLVRTVGPELGELAMDDRDRLLVEVDAPLRAMLKTCGSASGWDVKGRTFPSDRLVTE